MPQGSPWLLKLPWYLQVGHSIHSIMISRDIARARPCSQDSHQKHAGKLVPCSHGYKQWGGQLQKPTRQLCPDSIISVSVSVSVKSVWLTDSEQKVCLAFRGNLYHIFRQQWCITSPWATAVTLLSPFYPLGAHMHSTWHHSGELLYSKIFPAGAGLKALTDSINCLWRNPLCNSDEITTSSMTLEAQTFHYGMTNGAKGFSSLCTQTEFTSLEPTCHFILDFKLLILGEENTSGFKL